MEIEQMYEILSQIKAEQKRQAALLEQIAQAVSNIPGAVTPLREAAHAVLNVLPDPESAETERLRRLLYGAPL